MILELNDCEWASLTLLLEGVKEQAQYDSVAKHTESELWVAEAKLKYARKLLAKLREAEKSKVEFGFTRDDVGMFRAACGLAAEKVEDLLSTVPEEVYNEMVADVQEFDAMHARLSKMLGDD